MSVVSFVVVVVSVKNSARKIQVSCYTKFSGLPYQELWILPGAAAPLFLK